MDYMDQEWTVRIIGVDSVDQRLIVTTTTSRSHPIMMDLSNDICLTSDSILIDLWSPWAGCGTGVGRKVGKGKLGPHAMKRVAADAHLPTPWFFEPAKRPEIEPTTA